MVVVVRDVLGRCRVEGFFVGGGGLGIGLSVWFMYGRERRCGLVESYVEMVKVMYVP